MNSWIVPAYLIVKLLVLIATRPCLSNAAGFYGTCNGSFSCGTISGIGYPFRRQQDPVYCGYPGFELNCDGGSPPKISIVNMTYQVLAIDLRSRVLKIVREDMIKSICPQDLVNTTIDHEIFDYASSYMNVSLLFGCPVPFNIPMIGSIFCDNNGIDPVVLLPGEQGPGSCKTSVVIPFPDGIMNSTGWAQFLQGGFEVIWKVETRACADCMQSSGQCVYNQDTRQTTCACSEQPFLANTCSAVNTTQASSSPSSGMQLLS